MSTLPPIIHVVDDDQDVRTALGRLLRVKGYRVVGSASAEEFFAHPPDEGASCVILDLTLPGPGGLDIQRLLSERKDPRPVLFLTGSGDLPSGVRAMKAGAVDFLTKPIDGDLLVAAVAEALLRGTSTRAERRAAATITERLARLTPREREIMERVAQGLPNKRIGLDLGIAEKTVKIHRARVMEKMEAESIADLVRMAECLKRSG
jgi:FixJ family two-component response regulator